MKSQIIFPAASSIAALFLYSVGAAQTPAFESDTVIRGGAAHAARLRSPAAPIKATDLIGMKIENNEEKKIGKVDDLAVDLYSGRVVELIVSTGGLLSMKDRTLGIPPGSFGYNIADKRLSLALSADRVKSAPAFEMSQWTEYYQSDRVSESARYYGRETMAEMEPVSRAIPATSAGASGLSYVQKATKLMGLPVRNTQDEKIGAVENLVIDLPSGRVVAVIVSSGGFLGLGDTLSVVPPEALKFNDSHDRLRLDTTKEALTAAPRFKAGEWPDFARADYSEGLQRAYRLEPKGSYAKTSSTDADNAARNVRDRGSRTLTPGNQGGSAGDVKITQQIRKSVVAAKGLSINAQNVKIITVDGRVTLRGPVATFEEKTLIGEMAGRAVAMDQIENQLEVVAR